MITRPPVEVILGDEDVLIGGRAVLGIASFWFSPLPADHGLEMNKVTPAPGVQEPEDAVAVVRFLNRPCLTAFIESLTRLRDSAFPEPKATSEEVR